MIELKTYQRTAVHELKERVKYCAFFNSVCQSYRKDLQEKIVRRGAVE